eukprot:9829252-Karenia_brevis.AAC.1
MRQWMTQENKDRKRDTKEGVENTKVKRVRFNIDEDGKKEEECRDPQEGKRKEESVKEDSSDSKRRKTQEEEEDNE